MTEYEPHIIIGLKQTRRLIKSNYNIKADPLVIDFWSELEKFVKDHEGI